MKETATDLPDHTPSQQITLKILILKGGNRAAKGMDDGSYYRSRHISGDGGGDASQLRVGVECTLGLAITPLIREQKRTMDKSMIRLLAFLDPMSEHEQATTRIDGEMLWV
jgi:hypothetical protein